MVCLCGQCETCLCCKKPIENTILNIASNKKITQELLSRLFNYIGGKLYWKVNSGSAKIGKEAGTLFVFKTGNKYRIPVNGKLEYRSRLVFLLHNGYLPKEVDHIDRDTLNDNIENLRAATRSQNNKNRCAQKNKSSNYLGVSRFRKGWQVSININGKQKHLGFFNSETEAALTYNKSAVIHHKEFANINIIT